MITIWVDGRYVANKVACFSIILRCEQHEWRRSVICGKMTTNQTELKAVQFALLSISKKFHNDEIVIYSSGRYAPMMLEFKDGTWIKNPSVNAQLVSHIRGLMSEYSNARVLALQGDPMLVQVKGCTDSTVQSGNMVFDKNKL
jgi:ribonuclease HI